jgi:ubiquitin carboxyl-terminal hydrolase 1
MFGQDAFRAWFSTVASNQATQQFVPLIILFLVPVLVLSIANPAPRNSLYYSIAMVLESLGLGFSWNWPNTHSAAGPSTHEKKKSKKGQSQTRAEQAVMNGSAKPGRHYIASHYWRHVDSGE